MTYLIVDESNGNYVGADVGYTPFRTEARVFTLSGALDYLVWIGRENWYRLVLVPANLLETK